jgi:putative DNA methylase
VTQNTDQPRLIEVAFPLKQASIASVHEKNVRHGHISTLHIWPARRPLAACRAALLATLLPDPGDPDKRQALLEKIGGRVIVEQVEKQNADGRTIIEEKEFLEGGVLAWGNENDSAMDELRATIREFHGNNPPRVLDPFAGGGAIPLEAMRLGCEVTASDINPVAWFILKCTLEYPQKFMGKKWPLPEFVKEWPDFVEDLVAGRIKKRKGKHKQHFTDPKQLMLYELPEVDLAWHVRAWGKWVLERARADLAARYPVVGGEPAVAYLWARTARDKMTMGRIPLLKTFWLCKKSGKRSALLPVPQEDGSGVTFAVLSESDFLKPEKIINGFPTLSRWDVTTRNLGTFLDNGTMNRAGVWSPCSGRPSLIALTMEDLRRQGQQGLLGEQMTAVVVESTSAGGKKTFKRYRAPAAEECKAAHLETEELEEVFRDLPFGIPDEPTPRGGGSGASRAFSVQRYGMHKWRDLFTRRQLMALGVFAKHTRRAIQEIGNQDTEKAEAIGAYLSLIFDRMADRGSTLCSWTVDWDKIRNTFARFALPMVWDFAETNTTIEASGGYPGQIELVARYLDHALSVQSNNAPPRIKKASAISVGSGSADLIITDPPYYDAIPYSDLMDFFHVWLRRMQHGLNSEMDAVFSDSLSPKWDHARQDGELIDDESRFGGDKAASKKAYEEGMARAFQRSFESLSEIGRLVIVFANKEVDAWETMIAALVRGGATVTASWPIQTERPNRARGISSAALSSSVWIVCRKRPRDAPAGWDTNVIERMKSILFDIREPLGGRNILQYYFDLGIRGPDFIWAAIGPALEAYSAHPFVKKTAGGIMTVPEFLKEVRRLVLQFSLGELPGFRDLQRDTKGRGDGLELDAVTQYYLLHRAYFRLDPVPAGPCILYANACGKNETELKVAWNIIEQGGKSPRGRPRKENADDAEEEESRGNQYRLLDWSERVRREGLGESRLNEPAPLIDRLHRLMFLLDQNRVSEMQQAFESWGLASERAFVPLLQAVRELAVRDKRDTERRLVEALATQLKMNRKVVVVDNLFQETQLFYDEKGIIHGGDPKP